ncbi:hypothetical protein [Nocardia sp. NPDC051750]|uniref:hypothetical protein n=1 Tax=Nocardia sp. NPDC051750 TaxID=3364325 RepID=UPI003790192A
MTDDYTKFDSLKGVYLEDSYVLEISESPGKLEFRLYAVLTPDSPLYKPPKPDAQYCYARGKLEFENVSRIVWDERSFQQYRDATGEVDYGNIDSLITYEGSYRVEGDWGSVRIWSAYPPVFHTDENSAVDSVQ